MPLPFITVLLSKMIHVDVEQGPVVVLQSADSMASRHPEFLHSEVYHPFSRNQSAFGLIM